MLAVAGGKGGCGKTTTALGLALAAAHRGRSVLAADADVDVPDLHRVAGVDGPDRRPDAAAPFEPRQVPRIHDLAVLPVRPGTDPHDRRERLADRCEDHDLVVVDCPAGGGPDAAVPLRAADRTLLVTTAEAPSLRDAAKTAAMSRTVGTPVAGAVVTRTEQVPGGVADLLDAATVEAVPPSPAPLDSDAVRRRYTRILRRLPGV